MRELRPSTNQRLKSAENGFCVIALRRSKFLVVYLLGIFLHCSLSCLAAHQGPNERKDHSCSVQAPVTAKSPPFEKVNINRASVQELSALPGIGESTAKRIVDYRKKNPPFRKIEELLIIRGISKNRLEVIKDKISVK